MAARGALLTIIHVSDLHLGRIDPATGDAQVSPLEDGLFAKTAWLDGVLGHHGRALEDLDAFYHGLLDTLDAEESPLVAVSGDLTRVGEPKEFDTADDYLISSVDLHPPAGNYVGLHSRNWRELSIPGNHDHWPGKAAIFGGPTTAFRVYFPASDMPFVREIPLSNGRLLQLIGIDTDSRVSPHGLKRLRAIGSFQDELIAVRPKLGRREPEQIRVLMMHHSRHHVGWTLAIDAATHGALDSFVADCGIQVILTGHVHTELLQRYVPNVRGGQLVLECRCGTTTQLDDVPYRWRSLSGKFPRRKWPKNTLLVHRLESEARKTFWRTETYARIKGRGFISAGPAGEESVEV